jgi:hypothetical protein
MTPQEQATYGRLADQLAEAFVWGQETRGHDYWRAIYDWLKDVSTFRVVPPMPPHRDWTGPEQAQPGTIIHTYHESVSALKNAWTSNVDWGMFGNAPYSDWQLACHSFFDSVYYVLWHLEYNLRSQRVDAKEAFLRERRTA